MSQENILNTFDDCTNRLENGQSIDECINLYPEYAVQLRPMLEAVQSTRRMRISQAEILQDQEIVWQMLESQFFIDGDFSYQASTNRYRWILVVITLSIVASLLFWWWQSHSINETNIIAPIIETPTVIEQQQTTPTYTATATQIPSATPTYTATATQTPSATPTYTATATQTPSATPTYTATATQTPTATINATSTQISLSATATLSVTPHSTLHVTSHNRITFTPFLTSTETTSKGKSNVVTGRCGDIIQEADLLEIIREIYPYTSIVSVKLDQLDDNLMVWDVITSHQIEILIDAECGYILSIERAISSSSNVFQSNTSSNDVSSINQNSQSTSSSSSRNQNDDDDDDDDDDSDDLDDDDDDD